jgi:hypothetical protein
VVHPGQKAKGKRHPHCFAESRRLRWQKGIFPNLLLPFALPLLPFAFLL